MFSRTQCCSVKSRKYCMFSHVANKFSTFLAIFVLDDNDDFLKISRQSVLMLSAPRSNSTRGSELGQRADLV